VRVDNRLDGKADLGIDVSHIECRSPTLVAWPRVLTREYATRLRRVCSVSHPWSVPFLYDRHNVAHAAAGSRVQPTDGSSFVVSGDEVSV
jgi:hypothetical protein